ncbi:hypothetical protein A4A49_56379, partial [Nicotiana attenuata]
INQATEYYYLKYRANNQEKKLSCNTNWRKPHVGWIKLNFDRAYKQTTSGIGGVVRDHNGNWIMGFNMKVQAASYIHAELLALQQSLMLAMERNLFPIEIETDSIQVLNLLENGNSTFDPLLHNCKWLLSMKEKDLVVQHSFREGNGVADLLAKEAAKQTTINKLVFIVMPSPFVVARMLADRDRDFSRKSVLESTCRTLAKFEN